MLEDETAKAGIAAIAKAIDVIAAEELPAEVVNATEVLEAFAEQHQEKYADLFALRTAMTILKRRAGVAADD